MNDQRKVILDREQSLKTENKKMIFSFQKKLIKYCISTMYFLKLMIYVFFSEIKANYGNAFDEKKIELFSKIRNRTY